MDPIKKLHALHREMKERARHGQKLGTAVRIQKKVRRATRRVLQPS